jgi:hypothetical protein
MKEAVTDAQQRPGFPLRSLGSLEDGNENRSQLFAVTRVLPDARPFGLPIYVALLPAGSILVAKVRAFPR